MIFISCHFYIFLRQVQFWTLKFEKKVKSNPKNIIFVFSRFFTQFTYVKIKGVLRCLAWTEAKIYDFFHFYLEVKIEYIQNINT